MDTTVLADIKQMLGIEESSSEFDIDILSAINSALFILWQLGVGVDEQLRITESSTWNELNTSVSKEVLRDYIYLKVRLVFDPPQSSFIVDAVKDRISELEFRMNISVDNGGGEVVDG